MRKSRRLRKHGGKSDERDAAGRFKRGNRASRGNRGGARRDRFRVALREAVTADDVEAIIKRAVHQARRGSHVARCFLAERIEGRARLADREPIPVRLPRITNDATARDALRALVSQVASGALPLEHAQALAALIGEVRRRPSDGATEWPDDEPGELPDPTFL